MRLWLNLMPGFTPATSLSDLAALALRILTWEPRWPTAARAWAGDRSALAPSTQPIGTPVPSARDFHCPPTCAGAHLPRTRPGSSRVAHHHDQPLNDHVGQRLLYDGPGPDARLIGIEYLVSDELYRKMPAEERLYWHDHQYDGDAGLVRNPTQSGAGAAARAPVRARWGKVYHTWISGGDYPRGPTRPFWSDTGELPLVLPPGAQAQLGVR